MRPSTPDDIEIGPRPSALNRPSSSYGRPSSSYGRPSSALSRPPAAPLQIDNKKGLCRRCEQHFKFSDMMVRRCGHGFCLDCLRLHLEDEFK